MLRAGSAGFTDSMRTVFALAASLAILSSASAQSAESVTVNPGAVYGGGAQGATQVLIDPGTGQRRVVPPLLQPWQAEPIKLHPLRKHHATRSTGADLAAAPAPPTPEATTTPVRHKPHRTAATAAPVESEPSSPPVEHKPSRTASAAPARQAPPPKTPAQQNVPASGLNDLTDLVTQSPSQQQTAPRKAEPPKAPEAPRVEKPVQRAAAAPAPKPAEPPHVEKPVKQASIEPSRPAKAKSPTGTAKDSVIFAPNASDPSASAVSGVRSLAGSLNTALGDSNARVQLMAYAGARGEKSSDTRRLSLKRALVVRQLLIDDGVPSERIDVFALGGADDDGPLDRVDVFVKS